MEHSRAGVLKLACICTCWHPLGPDQWKDICMRFHVRHALVSHGTTSTAQHRLKKKANAS